jgi:hypothetical protein
MTSDASPAGILYQNKSKALIEALIPAIVSAIIPRVDEQAKP